MSWQACESDHNDKVVGFLAELGDLNQKIYDTDFLLT